MSFFYDTVNQIMFTAVLSAIISGAIQLVFCFALKRRAIKPTPLYLALSWWVLFYVFTKLDCAVGIIYFWLLIPGATVGILLAWLLYGCIYVIVSDKRRLDHIVTEKE